MTRRWTHTRSKGDVTDEDNVDPATDESGAADGSGDDEGDVCNSDEQVVNGGVMGVRCVI